MVALSDVCQADYHEESIALAQRGWAVLPKVLNSNEVAKYVPLLRAYILEMQATPEGVFDTPEGQYCLNQAPSSVADFVHSQRLGELAARFLGVDAVRVLHFAGLFKQPGGAATPWHQDLSHIPLDTDKVISIWIPLHDLSVDMGPLVFADGSHHHGELDLSAMRGFPLTHNGPMQAGDVSIHLGWTLHGSIKNVSAARREAFAICYFADGSRISKRPGRHFSDTIMNNCFPTLSDGDLASGPLNPVIHRLETSVDARREDKTL